MIFFFQVVVLQILLLFILFVQTLIRLAKSLSPQWKIKFGEKTKIKKTTFFIADS